MKLTMRLTYVVLGGLLALGLAFGAYATFAQTDDGEAVPESTTPDSETGAAPAVPFRGRMERGFGGERGLGADDGALAAALDMTVEELAAARSAARRAAIDQAVADGLITQEQADQLAAGAFRGRLPLGEVDHDALLAEALGISVEDLQAARDQVMADRLAAAVEAGTLTQEQADLIQARRSVKEYIDVDALQATVQSFYEDAVADALAAGVITQAQADQLLTERPAMGRHGFGGPGMGGRRGHGHHGAPGFGGFVPMPDVTTETTGA